MEDSAIFRYLPQQQLFELVYAHRGLLDSGPDHAPAHAYCGRSSGSKLPEDPALGPLAGLSACWHGYEPTEAIEDHRVDEAKHWGKTALYPYRYAFKYRYAPKSRHTASSIYSTIIPEPLRQYQTNTSPPSLGVPQAVAALELVSSLYHSQDPSSCIW